MPCPQSSCPAGACLNISSVKTRLGLPAIYRETCEPAGFETRNNVTSMREVRTPQRRRTQSAVHRTRGEGTRRIINCLTTRNPKRLKVVRLLGHVEVVVRRTIGAIDRCWVLVGVLGTVWQGERHTLPVVTVGAVLAAVTLITVTVVLSVTVPVTAAK